MNDNDILTLLEGSEEYFGSYTFVKKDSAVIKLDGIIISESSTMVEVISFGRRTLVEQDICEDFDGDLSWM